MADPTKYTPSYDFSDYQATNPKDPLPGTRVDIELQDISEAIGKLVDASKDLRRDDGKLKNNSVGPDQLSPALSIGFTNRGMWAEGEIYAAGDGVFHEDVFYSARENNAAILDNAPDLAPNIWRFLFSVADVVIPENSLAPSKLKTGVDYGDKIGSAVWTAGTYRTLRQRARDTYCILDAPGQPDPTGANESTASLEAMVAEGGAHPISTGQSA